MIRHIRRTAVALGLATLAALGAGDPAAASSHREAPFVTQQPQIDGTDFYMFRSFEPGREGFVTLVTNYIPLQDPYGGPNYYSFDDNAIYEIHIDNNGDAQEDLTFQFRFKRTLKDIAINVGEPGSTKRISIPLRNIGPLGAGDTTNLNVEESFTLDLVRGDRRTGTRSPITRTDGTPTFGKPHDNIGSKSIPDYSAYASAFVYDIALPGSTTPGRVFVGQRKDPFVVKLGKTFDLLNVNPLGAEDAETDDLAEKNVTALCLELPISFLTDGDPVIGAWTTASLRQARVLNPSPSFGKAAVQGGAWAQVSRLGAPLVNEVVIGLKDKDKFNASEPKDDAQFLDYVTNPTLPEIIEILFGSAGVEAPNLFPRDDLIAAFLTGFDGLNQPVGVAPSEMLRLNTSIDPRPKGSQLRHGVIAGDIAGFPNGRRPGDDVVDIALRVAMGAVLPPTLAPSGQLPFTDGAIVDDGFFDATFPYLRDPLAGDGN